MRKPEKLKIGDTLIDDCDLYYKVIEIFTHSIAVQPMGGEDLACEIITYECLHNEQWKMIIDLDIY